MQVVIMGTRGESEETERVGERPNKGPVIPWLPLRTSGTHSYWETLRGTYIIEGTSDLSSRDQEAGSYPLSPFPIG